jgi:uncharacterized membrane protein
VTDAEQPEAQDDDEGVPQTLVGISFPDIYRAQEFLTAATGLAAKNQLKLKDAVLVVKEQDGKTHVKETIDPEPGRTALSGALWAGLFGLVLGGPVGWAAGLAVGGVGGAVTAKVVDLGISDEWVAWFREAVQPGTSTVALLIEDLDRTALIEEAGRFTGAELVYANLEDFTLDRIKEALAGHTVETTEVDAP